jgi:NitT/TauT family transport system permease protein
VAFGVQEFLLPRPSVIGTTFLEIYSRGLISVAWNTFQNAFWGFMLGCSAGILTGLISARFTSFSRALLPLAIAANSVPMIAFAPIMNNWFGALNPMSKIAIVGVLTYFPAMISTIKGLTSVDATSLELMKSYAAGPMEIFVKLRFPNAMPYIFSALKVSTTLSMIGAIVSEYFGGSTQGLGYRIREDAALFRYPESWSAIIVASLLGILFYLLVTAVERLVMPWHVSFRDE